MAEPNEGFITLHRRIREHPYWEDPHRLRAWIDILFMAAWKPHRRLIGGSQVEVARGEFIASERFLMNRWDWSRGKVRRYLEQAQQAGEIEPRGSTRDGTIYLVVNYDTYQNHRPTDGTIDSTTDSTRTSPETVPGRAQIEVSNNQEQQQNNKGNTADVLASAIGDFCSAVDAEWKLKTSITEWADGLRTDARYAGLDLEHEIIRAAEYHQGEGNSPKAPDRSIRNWLEKANEIRRRDRNGRDQPSPTLTPAEQIRAEMNEKPDWWEDFEDVE